MYTSTQSIQCYLWCIVTSNTAVVMALHVQARYVKRASNLLVRCQSTVTMADHGSTNTKPFYEMPSPPAWPVIGHLPLLMKEKDKIDKMFERLREQYGDIYRVYAPGQGDMVVIFRPEDIKMLYGSDGKIPMIPGFDMFEFVRKTSMVDKYTTPGLLNNTEDWYEVRHKVQQDMMRPKSALYYIDEMEEIILQNLKRIYSDVIHFVY